MTTKLFFLLAGIHAAFAIPLWIGLLQGLGLPQLAFPAPVWHAHDDRLRQ